jgi:hypothetical protein
MSIVQNQTGLPEKKAQDWLLTTPAWARDPFGHLCVELSNQQDLLEIAIAGISRMRLAPRMVKELERLQRIVGQEPSVTPTDHERAKRQAELAEREITQGFPLLHRHAAIVVWSGLEATVRLFVARWLQQTPDAMATEAVQKIRVKLADYERLQGEDRFFYIVDRLEQETSAPLKCGVARFESLLEPFHLSGPVEESTRRTLFELNHVRNVVLHRASVVDRRFHDACPWFNLKPGDKLQINHEAVFRYFLHATRYAIDLLFRIHRHFGTPIPEALLNPPEAHQDATLPPTPQL